MVWRPIVLEGVEASSGAKLVPQEDGSWLATGGSNGHDKYELVWSLPVSRTLNWLRIQALTHPDLPHNGPGRAFNSNFVLNEIKLFQQVGNKWVPVPLAEVVADYSQRGFEIEKSDRRQSVHGMGRRWPDAKRKPGGGCSAETTVDGRNCKRIETGIAFQLWDLPLDRTRQIVHVRGGPPAVV